MPCSAFNELRYKLILPTNKRTFNALRSSAPLFSHLLLSPLVWWTCGKCEKPHRHKNKSYNTTHDISPHIRIVRPFDLQCFLLSIDQKPGRNGSLLCFSTCASDFISGVWPSFCNAPNHKARHTASRSREASWHQTKPGSFSPVRHPV